MKNYFNYNRKPKAEYVLLIFENGMTCYTIKAKRLTMLKHFAATDEGIEEFSLFISEVDLESAALIVDSIAEDFIVESVAHVLASDRRALLNRKLDHHFRKIRYRNAWVIGREPKGRRDDRVLFSALSKNEVVDPWISCLLNDEVRITSISSPAYAIRGIVKQQKFITSDYVLVANWERSGIRQSFFQKGKMIFSRLARLQEYDPGTLAATIMELSEQSKDYLQRIKLIPYEVAVDVHIITPQLEAKDFLSYAHNNVFGRIEHYSTEDILSRKEVDPNEKRQLTALSLCIHHALTKEKLKNVYGDNTARRFHLLQQTRVGIRAFCILVFMIAAGFVTPELLDGFERRANYEQISQRQLTLDVQYARLTEEFPETPIPPYAMEVAVDAYDNIVAQRRSPVEAMRRVSSALASQPNISLDSFEWRMEPDNIGQSITASVLQGTITESLVINASVLGAAGFTNSNRIMQDFFDVLGETEGAVVTPLNVPVDSRPDTSVAAVVDDEVLEYQFQLSVRYTNPEQIELEPAE